MGDDQVLLQQLALILGNDHIAELTEASGDPVYDLSLLHQLVDHLSGGQDLFSALIR